MQKIHPSLEPWVAMLIQEKIEFSSNETVVNATATTSVGQISMKLEATVSGVVMGSYTDNGQLFSHVTPKLAFNTFKLHLLRQNVAA